MLTFADEKGTMPLQAVTSLERDIYSVWTATFQTRTEKDQNVIFGLLAPLAILREHVVPPNDTICGP